MILAVPFSNINLDNHKVDSFLKELNSDLRYVRKANQSGRRNIYIELIKNYEKNGYILKESGIKQKVVLLPKGAEIKSSTTKLIFDSKGSLEAQDGKGLTITIKNKNRYKQLTIVPFSGRILIKDDIYG